MEHLWTNQLQQDLNEIYLTPEGKEKLIHHLKTSQSVNPSEKRQKDGYNSHHKGLWVAACLCILSGTAYATGMLQPVSEILAPIFGETVAQTEIIDQIGRPLNASDTENGITITAEAIIGDANHVTMVFKITNSDGSAVVLPEDGDQNYLLTSERWVDLPVQGGRHEMWGHVLSEDGHYRLIHSIYAEEGFPLGKNVTALFEDLNYYDGNGTMQCLFKGEWELKFKLNYEDSSLHIPVQETFIREGIVVTVESILVSPLSLRVNYSVAIDEKEHSREALGEIIDRWMEDIQIGMTTKEGIEWDLRMSTRTSSITQEGWIEVTMYASFNEIIPLETIDSVTVGGISVFLEEATAWEDTP